MSDNTILPGDGLGRRNLMKRAGIGAAALGLAATTLKPATAIAATADDLTVLTFALNLEYLEAEYYLRGVTGAGLTSAETGNATSLVTGGRQVAFSTEDNLQYFEEIAQDELNHVLFLRSAITTAGATPASEPTINFTDAFNGLAVAAGLGSGFDPFASEADFLLGAFVFEDVGVTAYLGGAGLISTPAYLVAAAQILAVEAYHAGEIRTRLYQQGLFKQAHLIASLRNTLSMQAGSAADDQGIYIKDHINIVPTDGSSLTFVRSVAQVTNIVTAGGGTKGGFFPDGLAQPVAS